ncbi:S26 family signal peptidase [Brevundimonas viscosa]|uniref:S26 family signal peptidase n=1 Tax=Brevundimonas viscosa TaxID=871741 RepID=UPI001FE9F812|nr:S26 family signal peptidase [Brevundimonas viscosa]
MKRFIVWLAAPLAGLSILALGARLVAPIVLINESRSLPPGLYLRQPGQTLSLGAVVAAEPPPEVRRYLSSLGVDADIALLKRVAALPGQPACAHGRQVLTPLRPVFTPALDQLAPPPWRECRLLTPDEVFLLGDSDLSYDSRYFGPVKRSRLRGVYRRVLTW